MTKTIVTITACATLLWAGTALATPTPQQNCDSARITAWKVYTSCSEAVVARDALQHVSFDEEQKAFWKCRHAYFRKWTAFQTKASLATSTCVGSRFADNGTTIMDNFTGLEWEKKTNLDGTVNFADPHDGDNNYTWSTGAPYKGDGTVFATFLTDAGAGLNVTGFAGAKDWRLPTLAELQSIMLDYPCRGSGGSLTCLCHPYPCVDSGFASLDPNTQYGDYWSATTSVSSPTSSVPYPAWAWYVYFYDGSVFYQPKTYDTGYGRAVRDGL